MTTQAATPAPAAPAEKRTMAFPGGELGRYLLIRFLLIIPTIFILVTMVFIIMRVTGDPITAAQGGRLSAEQLAALIHEAGYDRPVLVQYTEYLGQILSGDLGTTLTTNKPVVEIFATYGPATLELAFYALIVAVAVGIPLGMLAAYHRDRAPDATFRIFAVLAYATPVFFAGIMAKLVFSVWLGWLPVSGRASTGAELQMQFLGTKTGFYTIDAILTGDPAVLGDVLRHAVLPALVLGLATASIFLRLVRTNVIGTFSADYVDAARSRGVSEYRLVRTHAYRPALIPIITVIGLQVALVLGGAVLTETTFEWKGLGFMLTEFVRARDFVAVQGMVVLLAVIVAVTNFVVDVIAAAIDPRVRY